MKRLTTKEFIKKAIVIHGDTYDYSKSVYVLSTLKCTITCKEHGDFEQTPNSHTKGSGCPVCSLITMGNERSTTKDFITKSNNVHNNRYSYHKTDYITSKQKVIITCDLHGDFIQSPNDHLNGCGCPTCRESIGEQKIRRYLEENSFYYEQEKRFKGCKNKHPLPFDFYVPSENILIEFQGRQHYIAVDYFGGKKALNKQQKHDGIKRDYCKLKGIRLLEIPYTSVKKIEIILRNHLNNKL